MANPFSFFISETMDMDIDFPPACDNCSTRQYRWIDRKTLPPRPGQTVTRFFCCNACMMAFVTSRTRSKHNPPTLPNAPIRPVRYCT